MLRLFGKISTFLWGNAATQDESEEDLVTAEDNQIYKRQVILKWFEDLESTNQDIISPCTSSRMGKNLAKANVDLKDVARKKMNCVEDFMKEVADKIDPVLADDGNVYSRAVIQAWFDTCRNRGLRCKSPIDGRCISATLAPYEDSELYHLKRAQTIAAYKAMSSIQDLGDVFENLDKCKEILNAALNGWIIPCVVIFGAEKVGKSSLIERLTMMNIFPRDHHLTCTTRMPICAHLRRGPDTGSCYLEIVKEDGTIVEGSRKYFNLNTGAITVREAMMSVVPTGMTYEFSLSLHIQRPDVPTLDMVDLPGIISNRIQGEPENIAEISRIITTRYIEKYRGNAIFLAVVPCTKQIRQDVSLGLVEDLRIQGETLGVISRCDEMEKRGRIDAQYIKSLVGDGTGGVVQMKMVPHGYVCCINERKPPPTPPIDNVSVGEGLSVDYSFEQLFQQGTDEYSSFANNDMQDLIDCGRATTNALIHRIQSMYKAFLRNNWLPRTLQLLNDEIALRVRLCHELGDPAAHESTLAIAALVKQAMADALVEEFCPKMVTSIPKDCIEPFISTFSDAFTVPTNPQLVFDGIAVSGAKDATTQVVTYTIPSYRGLEKQLQMMSGQLCDRASASANTLANRWKTELCTFLKDHPSPIKFPRFPDTVAHLGNAMFDELFSPVLTKAKSESVRLISDHICLKIDSSLVKLRATSDGGYGISVDYIGLYSLILRQIFGLGCVQIESQFAAVCKAILDDYWVNGNEVETDAVKRKELLHILQLLRVAAAHIEETLTADE